MKNIEKTTRTTTKRTSNARINTAETKQQRQRIREQFPFYEFRRN